MTATFHFLQQHGKYIDLTSDGWFLLGGAAVFALVMVCIFATAVDRIDRNTTR